MYSKCTQQMFICGGMTFCERMKVYGCFIRINRQFIAYTSISHKILTTSVRGSSTGRPVIF